MNDYVELLLTEVQRGIQDSACALLGYVLCGV
jgi:hypothetical protein